MATRTKAFERIHVNIERLGVYFPSISRRPFLLNVSAWENLSEENKKAIGYSQFLEEPRKKCGGRLENTYDVLKNLREELEEGECSPARFIYEHLGYIDRMNDHRQGLGMAHQVRKHMEYLLATADESIRSELVADGWGNL